MELFCYLLLIGVAVFVVCGIAISSSANDSPPKSLPPSSSHGLTRPTPPPPPRGRSASVSQSRNSYRDRDQRPVASSSDDGFLASMAIGYATDNALLGGLAGGNMMGGMVGDMPNSGSVDYGASHHSPAVESWSPPSYESPSFDSSPSYDSGSSSYDSSSSFDSGSSSSELF